MRQKKQARDNQILMMTAMLVSLCLCVQAVDSLQGRGLILLWGTGALALLIFAGGLFLRMRVFADGYVSLAAAAVCVLIFSPSVVMGGLLGFLNDWIAWWNLRFEDGKRFFEGAQVTDGATERFLVVFLLLGAVLAGRIARSGKSWLGAVWLFGLFLPGYVTDCYGAPQYAALFAALAAVWTGAVNDGLFLLRRMTWLVILLVFLSGIAYVAGDETLSRIHNLRQQASDTIERLRYGEDTLPQGDLSKADQLKKGKNETLQVTADQVKSLYLRGFIGADYEDGKWEPLSGAAYGLDNTGLFSWLTENGLEISTQYATYAKLDDQTDMQENHVSVKNIGARRNYLYLPYSAESIETTKLTENKDLGPGTKKIFGADSYRFIECAQSNPAELLYQSGWVQDAQTDEQEEYLTAEAAYRQFVYENYTEIDDEMRQLMDQLFWEDAKTEEKESVYTSAQRIREVLASRAEYTEDFSLSSDGTDAIRSFLLQDKKGNAALFASAAVMAFRANGIPARYTEGYLVTEEALAQSSDGTVSLTDEDAHVWPEVYIDGIGWAPVDVTPGYYYDTYALMEMLEQPRSIQQTAALEDGDEEAEELLDDGGRTGNKPSLPKERTAGRIVLGVLVLVLILMVLFVIGMEARRLARLELWRRRYQNADTERRAELLGGMIGQLFAAAGLSARIGWRTKENAEELCLLLPDFSPSEYDRVNALIEKSVYGEESFSRRECSVLEDFIEKFFLASGRLGWRRRLRVRYLYTRQRKEKSGTKSLEVL